MKLLITGGAGFIGSNFVHYWLQNHEDDEVVVLDKLTYAGNLASLADIKDKKNLTFIRGDIGDAQIAEQAMAGCDVVVHFAAESHVDRSVSGPMVFTQTNVVGTQVLLETARKLGIERFHHVSTDEVLGSLPLETNERWNESSPYAPRSPYAASKAASDHLVRAYANTYLLPVTISNCANNYGPYMYPEKLLPLAITNLLEGKKVPVYTPGNQIREWLHVSDHCRAIDTILLRGKLGETYFIGPDEPKITNLELIKKLLSIMDLGEDRIEFVADRPGHDQRYSLDTSKIESELGWHAEVALDDGLRQMVEWYRSHEQWWRPIKSGEFRKYYEQQYKTAT